MENSTPTVIDPKRTGVKATAIKFGDPGHVYVDNRWRAAPGSMLRVEGGGIGGFLIACPGCGCIGAAKEGASWRITAGTVADVSTITLEPSIAKGCCGWHGYLRNGVFESC